MDNNRRKYILVPEYRPMWAMRYCFGPTHGPLTEPCPTPLDVIRELLMQDGDNKLTIMEVIKTHNGFSDPVQLTLDNYTLPYEEIVSGKKKAESEVIIIPPPNNEVKATVIDDPSDESIPAEVLRNAADIMKDETDKEILDYVGDDEKEADPAKNPEVTEDSSSTIIITDESEEDDPSQDEPEPAEEPESVIINGGLSVEGERESDEGSTTVVSDPYAGMTKSQRRAARKKAEAEAAQRAAQQQ